MALSLATSSILLPSRNQTSVARIVVCNPAPLRKHRNNSTRLTRINRDEYRLKVQQRLVRIVARAGVEFDVAREDNLGERVFGRERWSSWVAKLVTASSAAAVWVTSAAIVVLLVVSEPRDAAALNLAPRKLQGDELATVQLFQDNTPSVVYITNLAVR